VRELDQVDYIRAQARRWLDNEFRGMP
jgi:hypothetical protein